MRGALRWLGRLLVLVVIAIQFVRPARTSPPTDASRALHAHAAVPARAAAVLDRACRDCHSNETRWPWYSHVAPVSWFVIDHVNHGRSHFNYSDWARYERDDARRLLKNACDFARRQTMPLPSYTLINRSARLTDEDIVTLCDWAERSARDLVSP
jgi:hypothetical protein